MAITIVEQPQSYTPLYNDIVTVLSSNKTSEAKFKFCLDVDVYIEELASYTNLGRLKSYAVTNPLTLASVGFFNIKDILRGSNYFATKDNFIFHDISHSIRLTPGEEYASAITAAPVYYASSGVITCNVFNGALRLKEYIDFAPTDLINTTTIAATSGIGQYALTTYTEKKRVLYSTLVELSFLCNGGTNTKARVTYYNGNTTLTTQDISLTTANRTDVTVDISPSKLTLPVGCTRYTVQLLRVSNNNPLSPAYEYEFNTECTKFDKANVYFQNKWGDQDSFIFDMRETKTDSINRKKYQKQDRYISTYDPYSQSQQTYSSEIKTQHVLNTNWVTEAEMNWLSELVESNMVQMSYDSELTTSAGTAGSFRVNFTNFVSEGARSLTEGISLVTPIGTIGFSYPSGGTYDTFADDYINYLISTILPSSTLATYYDFSASLATSTDAILLCTQKTASTSTNITSSTPTNVTITNVVAGTNSTYNVPQLIPVSIDTNSFVWKKSTVDKLFQLELTVTETPIYNRQLQ